MKICCITPEERLKFQPQICNLEQAAQYPLGNDFFRLDHGDNYFAFFDRLGEVNYYVALDGERVAAVGAGILRQIGDRLAWYLCDLKVHPDYQGRHLCLRILRHAIPECIQRCDRGYAILMNPSDGTPSRLATIYQRLSPVKFSHATTLNLYSLDAEAIADLSPLLVAHRGPISYLSLRGIKDLKLNSTGAMLPLLHVQWGDSAEGGYSQPLPGHRCMFCTPAGDRLVKDLHRRGLSPMATATVIAHGMEDTDWQFILTSEI